MPDVTRQKSSLFYIVFTEGPACVADGIAALSFRSRQKSAIKLPVVKTVVPYVKLDGKVSKQDAAILEYLDGKEVQVQSATELVMRKLTAANFNYEWQLFTPAQLEIAGAGEQSVLEMQQNDAGPACSDSAKGSEDFASADAVADVWRPSGLSVRAIRVFLNTETRHALPTNYSIQEEISEGTFGYVFRGKNNARGHECVAIKMLKGESRASAALQDALHEAQMHEYVGRSPYICQLLDVYFDASVVAGRTGSGYRLVFESMSMDLKRVLDSKPADTRSARVVAVLLCKAVAHIHSRGVIHTDISLKNVLVTSKGPGHPPPLYKMEIKLCDFGAAEYAGARTERRNKYDCVDKQTLFYRAPEVTFGDFLFTPVVDEWSVAAVLWECLAGAPLFAATCESDLIHRMFRFAGTDLLERVFRNDTTGRFPHYPRVPPTFRAGPEYPIFPATFPEMQLGRSGKSLVLGLLEIDPTKRWQAHWALQNCSYLQRRPILQLPAEESEGDRGVYMLATTELHPELLEKMRSAPLFQQPELQHALEIGWDGSKGYKERFSSEKNRAIQDRELGVKGDRFLLFRNNVC